MNKINPPSPLRQTDYKAIEEALLDSAQGRWFLSEYSRQNRTADTQMLLDAITKLEAVVMRPGGNDDNDDRIRSGLIEMSESIAQTRQEIAAITSSEDDSRLVTATEELDAIVEATEKATSSILEAAEDVQETAWVLRENGIEEETCDRLDQRATDIYTACSFQDITGQRTSKVVDILRYLENRVNSMIDIWGLENVEIRPAPPQEIRPDDGLLNGPQLDGHGLEQFEIDNMISVEGEEFAAVEREPATVPSDPVPTVGQAPAQMQQEAPPSPQADTPSQPQVLPDEPPAKAPRLPAAHSSSAAFATSPISVGTPETDLSDITAEIDYADTAPAVSASPARAETVEQVQPAPAELATAAAAQSDTVTADDFTTPQDLALGDLDTGKTDALFS
ncbi:MAG: hypothetical protein OEM91_00480 [Hyphomicrobiales bacterium]|nr:hypothetical protein [Hyphomicrobiales bacterium]